MNWDEMVLVGRVARPHGLRGDLVIHPETDFVEERFRVGATVWRRTGAGVTPLVLATARVQGGRPVVRFEGIGRIEEAEPLVGAELRVPETALQPLGPGEYYHHQLVGCAVETLEGASVGSVARVERAAGGSCLVVAQGEQEVMIPLADAICVEVNVVARRIRVNPPEGLLDLKTRRSGPRA